MKSPLVPIAVAVLSVAVTACGASSKGSSTSGAAATAASTTQASSNFKGDEDDDDGAGESTGSSAGDKDADFDNDQKDKERGYHDSDDSSVLMFGQAASPADETALKAVVKRYYAAAAAGDGAKACSLTRSISVKSIPEDYGQAPGPIYLRGKTCSVVLSRLFKHEHKLLIAPYVITGVRVNESEAYVLLGSKVQPASYVRLEHEGGAWKIIGAFGGGLP